MSAGAGGFTNDERRSGADEDFARKVERDREGLEALAASDLPAAPVAKAILRAAE